MASARAALGKARRGIIKRKKTTDVVTGALGAAATVTAFGAGQAKKAKTAWGEYEAGYKELGGDVADIKKPGFFKRTAQQILPSGKTGLPEGEVQIGGSLYDRSKIQEAGSFLSSDAAAVLDEDTRTKYLERTAPGREAPPITKMIDGTEYEVDTKGNPIKAINLEVDKSAMETARKEDIEYKKKRSIWIDQLKTPIKQAGATAQVSGVIPTIPQISIQDYEQTVTGTPWTPSRQHTMPGPNVNIDFKSQIKQGFKNLFSSEGFTGEGGGTGVKTGVSQIPKDQYSYAKGGDFITNGPQEILVGDNPGGRERVTVKPLSSKKDAEFGRNGDDAMKIIDGQPAHINEEIEGDMSPEDIKKHGYTINPITGKKEYFLGAIATGLAIGSSLYKGYQATQNKGDVAAGQEAAGDIYQERLDLLGDVKRKSIAGATAQAGLGFDVAQSGLAAEERNIGMGAQIGTRDTQEFGATATSQSGLATSGTIESKVETQKGDLMVKYKSDMTKLFEGREHAQKEKDIKIWGAKSEADLAYRSGQMSAEDAYQSTLTGLESQPTNFLEGMFS